MIIYHLVYKIVSIFIIWPILEARAEIPEIFRRIFGKIVDITNLFWNYLTFRYLQFSVLFCEKCKLFSTKQGYENETEKNTTKEDTP